MLSLYGERWVEAVSLAARHGRGLCFYDISVHVTGPGEVEATGKDKGKLTREEKLVRMWEVYYKRQANQRRAARAQLVHRANLLCALARGLLLDQAADEPLVQALALSVAEPRVLPEVHARHGIRADSLQAAASWCRDAFRILTPEEAVKKVGSAFVCML
jgi:hypothetical protein